MTLIYKVSLAIFDISSPANPVEIGSVTGQGGPTSVAISGRYAYVTGTGGNSLWIYDISNPANPVKVGSINSGLAYPTSVAVSGRYAYVTSNSGNSLKIINISNPTAPTVVGTVTSGLYRPISVTVSGRYAYVVNNGNSSTSALVIFDLGGTYTQTLQAGSAETGSLQVDNNAQITGDENIQGGLGVGGNLQLAGNAGINGNLTLTATAVSTPSAPTLATTTGGSLTAGTYYYELAATTGNGNTAAVASSPASIAAATNNENTLSWSAVAGATGYVVYESTNGTTWYANEVSSSTTSIIDNGTTYTWSGTAVTPPASATTGGNLRVQGTVLIGAASSLTGNLVFNNSSNANTITLSAGTTSSSYNLTLPTSAAATGQCLQAGTVSGSAVPLIFGACTNNNPSVSEVNTWSASSSGSSTTTLSDSPANIGDLMVLTTQIPTSSVTVSGISGGGVSTWTKVVANNGNGTVNRVEMWMGKVSTTGAGTITVTYSAGTGNNNEITATEFTASGVSANTAWGVDSSGTQLNSTASTTITYPSLTSAGASELYVGYAQSQTANGSAGSTSGFSYLVTTTQKNVIAYTFPTAAGTVYQPTASQTSGESNTVAAIITVFISSTAINNSTSLQQGNFNVQAATSGTVAGVLEANASGSADILDLKNGSGTNTASFGNTGSDTLTSTTNSTTAFQVQNALGNQILGVDTINSQMILGAAGSINGQMLFNTTSSNTITLNALTATSASYTLNLPTSAATTGQCLQAGTVSGSTVPLTWGLCGGGTHSKEIVLTPEYAGAVLSNLSLSSSSDVGTMTSGYDSTQRENYYQWTTSQSSSQTYYVVVQIPVPSDYSSSLALTVDTKISTSATVTGTLINSAGTTDPNWNTCSLTGSTGTWDVGAGCTVTAANYSANQVMTLELALSAPTSGTAQIGDIVLNYTSAY